MDPKDFSLLDAALDEVLDLPRAEQHAAIARIAAGDAATQRRLHALLSAAHHEDPLLDRPAWALLQDPDETTDLVATGTRIGVYEIERLIGRGGMGEVYAARRVDGGFHQRVAIKLLRADARAHESRFDAERQVLARLEHPNIARLLDGGVTADGRAYMVMALVEGVPVTRWCAEQAYAPAKRLELLLQVCDAVACAHANLVVHRDIKPANVLVTRDGVPMLLDFGISRQLALPSDAAVTTMGHLPLTLAYAAPEQLTAAPVTTATDIHALGLLMFELLAGRRPWDIDDVPIAAALNSILKAQAPPPSALAPKSLAPALRGDLDAIVAKALRKDPAQRYATVAALAADVRRHLRHEAVGARSGARWYAFTRMAWRHRALLAAFSIVAVVSTGAAIGLARQAQRADLEAQRAKRSEEFLASIFRATDTRTPTDKPRGDITARELLDRNAERIEAEFADDPALQVELLGLVTDIYSDLDEDDRYRALQRRRMEAAMHLYGPMHPVVIAGLLSDARQSLLRQDYASARGQLDVIDTRLRTAGLDDTELRAQWWVARAEALAGAAGTQPAARDADDHAIALLRRIDPRSPTLAEALDNLAQLEFVDTNYAAAETLFQEAIDVQSHLRSRNDPDLATLVGDHGKVLAVLGLVDQADRAFAQAEGLFLKTTGPRFGTYWQVLADHALMLHERGDRPRAAALFATLRAAIPSEWQATTDDAIALERYARSLVAEGRAGEALPLLRWIEQRQRHDPMWPEDLRRARLTLGNALAATGAVEAGLSSLRAAVGDYTDARAAATPDGLEARRSLASALLDEASQESPRGAATARAQAIELLQGVTAAGDRLRRLSAEPALAEAELARAALQTGDGTQTLARLAAAQAAYDAVTGLKDVRGQWRIWRVRVLALAATGQRDAARMLAARARQERERAGDAADAPS